MPQPAPLGKRFVAFLLDYLIIAGYLIALLAVGTGLTLAVGPGPREPLAPLVMDLVAFLFAVLPVILYFALQEGGPSQATFGKRRVGIRVAAIGGGNLSRGRAFARSVFKFAPWQLAHTSLLHIPGWPFDPEVPGGLVTVGLVAAQGLVALYVVLMVTTRTRQTPYDWMAGAVVTLSSAVGLPNGALQADRA